MQHARDLTRASLEFTVADGRRDFASTAYELIRYAGWLIFSSKSQQIAEIGDFAFFTARITYHV
jgi:hypothetical protein